MPRWIYTGKTYLGETIQYQGSPSLILDAAFDQVRDEYDYIIIDTPPSLSEQLLQMHYVPVNMLWYYLKAGLVLFGNT